MTSALAKKILREHPNGFVGCIVEGARGIGKTSYCLQVSKEVYKTYKPELTETEAYHMALDYCLFDVDDVLRVLKKARKEKMMIPCVVWDDAGAFASSLLWFINIEAVTQLKSIMDTVRTAVTGFIINCPDRGGLMKNLREYDDYLVKIVKAQGGNGINNISKETGQPYKNYQRTARGYTSFKIPSGKRIINKNFEDDFSCYLPKEIFKEYMIKRDMCLDKAVELMEETKAKKLSSKTRRKISEKIYDIELNKKYEKMKQDGLIKEDE